MNQLRYKFFDSKHIALIGVSHKRACFGNAVIKTLEKNGFNVYPIHPEGREIEGVKCLPDIESLPPEVNSLIVCLSPKIAVGLIDKIASSRIKRIWFQQGADFSAAAQKAREAGLETIEKKCALMYAPPVTGIHKFHRFFARLIGRY
jgi:predicted CoA-binding protein